MTVIAGSIKATLSSAVGGDGPASPLATAIEGLTEGHWDGIAENIFPPAGVDFEILYPIIPQANSNRFTFRDDRKSWKNVQKSENKWQHEFNTIQMRLVDAKKDMATVQQFIEDNAGKVVSLVLPGVQAFLRPDETNSVFIKKISKPVREKENTYKISITFLLDPNQFITFP